MIRRTACAADQPTAGAANQFFIRNRNVDNAVQRDIKFTQNCIQRYRLRRRTRETVQDEAVTRIRLRQALANNADRHFIGYQRTVIHMFFCFQTERRTVFHGRAEHIARRNLRNPILFDESFRLRTFTGARRSH